MRLALIILGFLVVIAIITILHLRGQHQLGRYFTLAVVGVAAVTNVLHPKK